MKRKLILMDEARLKPVPQEVLKEQDPVKRRKLLRKACGYSRAYMTRPRTSRIPHEQIWEAWKNRRFYRKIPSVYFRDTIQDEGFLKNKMGIWMRVSV